MVLVYLLAAPTPAAAKPGDTGCLPNVGKRVPVLFVHGFTGGPGVWGSPNDPNSTLSVVSNIPGMYEDKKLSPFDYSGSSNKWVDNDNIGKKLAMQIACMAQSSREQRG